MKNGLNIDELARMTQDQFSRVDERFDSLESKFEARFDKVETQLEKMNGTLKTVLDVVLEIPSKKAFEKLENKVNIIDAELASVQRKISK